MNVRSGLFAQDLPANQESVPVPPSPASYVPQILIENVPPTSGIFPQSTATIVAALIALAAAGLALGGVFYAQSVARATAKAQLRQQRSAMIRQDKHFQLQLEKQQALHDDAQSKQNEQHRTTLREQRRVLELEIHAEKQKLERVDLIDALLEAARSLTEAVEACREFVRVSNSPHSLSNADEFDLVKKKLELCHYSQMKLSLLRAPNSPVALSESIVVLTAVLSNPDPQNEVKISSKQIAGAYDSAIAAFKIDAMMQPG